MGNDNFGKDKSGQQPHQKNQNQPNQGGQQGGIGQQKGGNKDWQQGGLGGKKEKDEQNR